MAPCEHLVHFYEEDDAFVGSLVDFAAAGLRAGESVVIIATPMHRNSLVRRLPAEGVDLAAAMRTDQYIALDAEETLSRFMVDGWPDDDRFHRLVHELLARAGSPGRRVRAFGEMVALLWGRGHNAATVRLEHLWHQLCRSEAFALYCAYPKIGLTQDVTSSFQEICAAHTRVVTT